MPEDTNEILNAAGLDDGDPGDETGTGDGTGDGNVAAVADESGAGSGAGAPAPAKVEENVQPAKVEEPEAAKVDPPLAAPAVKTVTGTVQLLHAAEQLEIGIKMFRAMLPDRDGKSLFLAADVDYVIPSDVPVGTLDLAACEAELAALVGGGRDPMDGAFAVSKLRQRWCKAREDFERELDRASAAVAMVAEVSNRIGNEANTRVVELKDRIAAIEADAKREADRADREAAEAAAAEAARLEAEARRKSEELAARG